MKRLVATRLEADFPIGNYEEALSTGPTLTEAYFHAQIRGNISKSELRSMTQELFRSRLRASLWAHLGSNCRWKARCQLTLHNIFG
jgi:hypothetical protein